MRKKRLLIFLLLISLFGLGCVKSPTEIEYNADKGTYHSPVQSLAVGSGIAFKGTFIGIEAFFGTDQDYVLFVCESSVKYRYTFDSPKLGGKALVYKEDKTTLLTTLYDGDEFFESVDAGTRRFVIIKQGDRSSFMYQYRFIVQKAN